MRAVDRWRIGEAPTPWRAWVLTLLLAGCGARADSGEVPPPGAATSGDESPGRAESAPASADAAGGEPIEGEALALARAFEARLTVWTRPDGSAVLSRRCREGPVPCRERLARFATLMVEVAREYDLDPMLLGALAFRESGLDPAALGRNGEAGIVQLHPRGAGRGVRYVEDAGYRARCQSELDACQRPVLEQGARTLARAIEECGGLVPGLGAYATGRCTERVSYSNHVLEERDRLRELAR